MQPVPMPVLAPTPPVVAVPPSPSPPLSLTDSIDSDIVTVGVVEVAPPAPATACAGVQTEPGSPPKPDHHADDAKVSVQHMTIERLVSQVREERERAALAEMQCRDLASRSKAKAVQYQRRIAELEQRNSELSAVVAARQGAPSRSHTDAADAAAVRV